MKSCRIDPLFNQNHLLINGIEEFLDAMISKMEEKPNYLENLVLEMCHMHSKELYAWIRSKEIVNFHEEVIAEGVTSSIYLLLRLMSKDRSTLSSILYVLLKEINTLKEVEDTTEREYDSFLSILHIVRWYLAYVFICFNLSICI